MNALFEFLLFTFLVFLVIWFLIIRPIRKRKEEREKLLEEVKSMATALFKEEKEEEACNYIKQHAPKLVRFAPELFVGKSFKEVRSFLYNIDRNYDEEEMFRFMIKGICREKDLQTFESLLTKAILYTPA